MYRSQEDSFDNYMVTDKLKKTQTQAQTTFYFPNHMIMTQGNTCTYINGLTNNSNSGDSRSVSIFTVK